MDYSAILLSHVESGADFTVGYIEVPRAEATELSVMSVDDEMRITRFTEKPAEPEAIPGKPDSALASMGIYVVATEFLFKLLIADAEQQGSSHDIGRDIIPANIHNCHVMAYRFVIKRVNRTIGAILVPCIHIGNPVWNWVRLIPN